MARTNAGFRERPQQVEMAHAVLRAIEQRQVLLAEAGTGTGKTFAYLVPALLAGGKVIISTGTKNLQDQLFLRDLPNVRKALAVPVTVALLKGRANYVCHYHLQQAVDEGRFASRKEVAELHKIERFARTSVTGDKAELSSVPETSGVWAHVTSSRDNCLGQDCPNQRECFVMAARKEALAADVVVVNHHLFFADVVLRDEGAGELLPACNTVIFDEAHQLPETARMFFGDTVSTSQIIELARDVQSERVTGAPECNELGDAARTLDRGARDLRLAVPGEQVKLPASMLDDNQTFQSALRRLDDMLNSMAEVLQTQAERSEGLAACARRVGDMRSRLSRWTRDEESGVVRWVEVFNQAMQLHATPLSVAELFRKQIDAHARGWIFTSATLSVKRDFSLFRAELGLPEGEAHSWESPFDFAEQALFYVPSGLPEPNTPGYTEAVLQATLPVLRASHGRAFILCTTLRAMQQCHTWLSERLRVEGLDYPLLVQGEGSRTELLDRFRSLGNAILIGSQSFWEGVDVRGPALSVVVIDKLPFAPPDDPVMAARIDAIGKSGGNAFMDYQLPRAAINLKQGAGRLIRDEHDRGVLMICDPRLVTRHYGRRIWQSLPPMRRTRELADVEQFFSLEPTP